MEKGVDALSFQDRYLKISSTLGVVWLFKKVALRLIRPLYSYSMGNKYFQGTGVERVFHKLEVDVCQKAIPIKQLELYS